GYFLHPRMVAVVHQVTIAWVTGSILGACYLVGQLALGIPMPVGRWDWIAAGAFVMGTAGMVAGFWIGRYDRAGESAAIVMAAILWVGSRLAAGSRHATAPGAVLLHVGLAFTNVLAAGALGILMAFDRAAGA